MVISQDFNKFMFENYLYSDNPPEFKRDAWYGLIFRWYGVDKIGNVAIFETGELPIPKEVFKNESSYRELDLFCRRLPKTTQATVPDEMSRLRTATGDLVDCSNWLDESSQGFFYIDELDTYGENKYLYGYYVKAIPNNKLYFNTLPSRIQELIEPYRMPVIFSEISNIKVENYLDCY
jgi:hypothetical protein